MDDDDPCCGNCGLWERGGSPTARASRKPGDAEPYLGTCQKAPPTVVVFDGEIRAVWPETHKDRWCCEWLEMPPTGEPDGGEEAPADTKVVNAALRFGGQMNPTVISMRPAASAISNSALGNLAGDSGGVRSPALDAQPKLEASECVNDGPGGLGVLAPDHCMPSNPANPATYSHPCAVPPAHGRPAASPQPRRRAHTVRKAR